MAHRVLLPTCPVLRSALRVLEMWMTTRFGQAGSGRREIMG